MPDHKARLEATIQSFQQQAGKVAQLRDKLADLRGQAHNDDGSVVVTAAPSGALLELQLGPDAMRYSHTQLQQEIMKTVRQATQHAAQALRATVEPVLGDRAEQFTEAFNAHSAVLAPGGPDEPPATAPPAERNRPRAAHVEDDDFGGSILR